MNQITVELFEITQLWFEIFNSENLDFESTLGVFEESSLEGTGPVLQLANNFDYVTLPNNDCQFYSDITIRLPQVASIAIRSQYSIVSDDFVWDSLFTVENIKPIVTNAIANAMKSFISVCLENSVVLSSELTKAELSISDGNIELICKDMVSQYFTARKLDDIANYPAQTEISLVCPSGNEINISLNLTFLVLDQLLFKNLSFNRRHNREVFFASVPEMKYNSLKLKCIQIEKHDVQLTVMDVHFLLICMDCALQTIMGDKSDSLIPVLEQRGVTSKVQEIWFKSATELFELFRKPNSGTVDIIEKHEWYKLIR